MSADFKLCIKCDKLVNILDDHDDCYRHRVCNSEFLCEICKSWTSEKPQSVERMIDKARLAATKKQSRSTDVETCPSSPLTGTRQFVASSQMREYHGHCQPLQGSYFGRSLSPQEDFVCLLSP
jgi:hypothetical protein